MANTRVEVNVPDLYFRIEGYNMDDTCLLCAIISKMIGDDMFGEEECECEMPLVPD